MNSRKLNIRTENWSEEPFSISRSYEDNFDVAVVEIEQNGFKGWGEGSPTEHYQESVQQTKTLIEDFREVLENGISRQELQQAMPKGAARNAVDCALWDLEAKLAGKRIWELPDISKHLEKYGKSKAESVTTVYTLSLDTPKKNGGSCCKTCESSVLENQTDR